MPKHDCTTPAKPVTPNKAKRPQQVARQSISILKTQMRDIKSIYKQEISLLQASVQKLEQENQNLKQEINKQKITRERQTRKLTLTKIDKSPCCNPLAQPKTPCRECHRQRLHTDKHSRSQLRTPTNKSPFTMKKNSSASSTIEIIEFMKEINKYLLNTTQIKQLPLFVKESQQTIIRMVQDLENKIKKGVTNINDLLKTHKQQLLSSIAHQTDQKLLSFKHSTIKHQQIEKKLIMEMPGEMKQLKQSCGAREQNHKKQIDLLQKQLVQQGKNHAAIVTTQQAQITDLRDRLTHLANTYHEHIQIPINSIRDKIHAQIAKVKAEFFKLHTDRTLNEIVNSVIQTVKKYLDYKDQNINGKLDEQIKKMSIKLSDMQDKSMKTLNHIAQIIKSKDFQQQIHPKQIEQKVKIKEIELIVKKKDFSYQQLEYKCCRQKEYLTALEKYNIKLQESVRRNSQQKTIFEDWAKYEQHFRTRQEQFNLHSDQVATQFRQAQAELIEIKKNLLINVQSNRDAICMFEQFQLEVTTIQSFKDQLFNYLENEIKLSKAIEDEVEIFNNIFVSQFNKFAALQTQIPNIEKVEVNLQTPVTGQLSIIKQDAENYINFKKEYLELFKEKRVIEAKVGKSLVALFKMHEEYLLSTKDKPSSITISLDQKLLKDEWERVNHNIQHMASSVRTIRQFVVKNMQTLKKQCERTNQQFNKLIKSVPTAISSFLHNASPDNKKGDGPLNKGSIISSMHNETQY